MSTPAATSPGCSATRPAGAATGYRSFLGHPFHGSLIFNSGRPRMLLPSRVVHGIMVVLVQGSFFDLGIVLAQSLYLDCFIVYLGTALICQIHIQENQ
jgi:hypothetical protein